MAVAKLLFKKSVSGMIELVTNTRILWLAAILKFSLYFFPGWFADVKTIFIWL